MADVASGQRLTACLWEARSESVSTAAISNTRSYEASRIP